MQEQRFQQPGATLGHTEPTLLLTNDDGWDAPGLEALRQAAAGLGRCRVIAPSGPLSGCGHRVTTHGPIAVTQPAADDAGGGRHAGRLRPARAPSSCTRAELGPRGNQLRRQPGHGRPSLRDRGGRSRGRPARSAGNRLVAVHRPRRGRRLVSLGAMGARRPPPADGTAPGGGSVLERQFPSRRAGGSRPGSRVLPARPFPFAARLFAWRPAKPCTRATTSRASAGREATSTSVSAGGSP